MRFSPLPFPSRKRYSRKRADGDCSSGRVVSPHMQRLYGNTLRKDAGVTKTLRNATESAKTQWRRKSFTSSTSNPDNSDKKGGGGRFFVDEVKEKISKKSREVQGTVEKVLEETEKALEEFLGKSKKSFPHLFYYCEKVG